MGKTCVILLFVKLKTTFCLVSKHFCNQLKIGQQYEQLISNNSIKATILLVQMIEISVHIYLDLNRTVFRAINNRQGYFTKQSIVKYISAVVS